MPPSAGSPFPVPSRDHPAQVTDHDSHRAYAGLGIARLRGEVRRVLALTEQESTDLAAIRLRVDAIDQRLVKLESLAERAMGMITLAKWVISLIGVTGIATFLVVAAKAGS